MPRWIPSGGVRTLTAVLVLSGCGGDAPEAEAPATETPTPEAGAPAAEPASSELLNPETASREQLLTVAGIDEALADALIAGRPFDDMRAVDAVLAGSLDEAQREEVYRHLWKPLDLNSASAEEILLIPGVGERMQHEFEEYRPYRAMAEFRREMAKYVDDAEVERLARYVTIR
jgi:DNA uptake protein ComE-like DNA-binding protein